MRHAQQAADYGVIIKGEITFDWDKIIKRSRGVAEKLSSGVEHLFKKYGVTQILGTATLTGRGKIEVDEQVGQARRWRRRARSSRPARAPSSCPASRPTAIA